MGFLDVFFGRKTQDWYNKQLDQLEADIREFQGKIEKKIQWLRYDSERFHKDYESWLTMNDEEFAKANPEKHIRGALTLEQASELRREEAIYGDAALARAWKKEIARVQRIINELKADMERYGYTRTYLKYGGKVPYRKGVWPR